MSDFDTILNLDLLEKRPLAEILVILVKYWDFQKVWMEIENYDCQSGIWIRVFLTYERRDYIADGSRIDVVKPRLMKLVRRILDGEY